MYVQNTYKEVYSFYIQNFIIYYKFIKNQTHIKVKNFELYNNWTAQLHTNKTLKFKNNFFFSLAAHQGQGIITCFYSIHNGICRPSDRNVERHRDQQSRGKDTDHYRPPHLLNNMKVSPKKVSPKKCPRKNVP